MTLKHKREKGSIVDSECLLPIDYVFQINGIHILPDDDQNDIDFIEEKFEYKLHRKPIHFPLNQIDEAMKYMKKGMNFVPVACVVENPDNWLPDSDYDKITIIELFEKI